MRIYYVSFRKLRTKLHWFVSIKILNKVMSLWEVFAIEWDNLLKSYIEIFCAIIGAWI